MPYHKQCDGDQCHVYKKGEDKPKNKKPMNSAQADKYMAALYAAEGGQKSLTDVDYAEIEEKCYSEMAPSYGYMKVDQREANYDPIGGLSGGRACANCRWFSPGSSSCYVVGGEIVATGTSDLWMAQPKPVEPSPMPVVIVEDTTVESGMESKASKDAADYAYVPDKELPSTWKLPIGDEKHARLALAAISSNPPHGNKVDIPPDAMPTVRRRVEAAVRKFVSDKDTLKELLGGKKDLSGVLDMDGNRISSEQFKQVQNLASQIKSTVQSFPLSSGSKAQDILSVIGADVAESGFKVLDNGRWIGWWTNNAQDKASEQFTLAGIDRFIARVDSKAVPYPELWHKHLHIPMGRADSLARMGYLAFATGTFYDTPTGQSGLKAYERDQAAGVPKTMSHQFLYPASRKVNGVIHDFNSFELSVLDKGEEANPITKFGVKAIMKVVLDAKKRAELLEKFGNDDAYVNKLLNFADITSKAMEEAGLDLKSLEAVDDILQASPAVDETAHAAIKELGEATLTGIKALSESIKEVAAGLKKAEDQATRLDATEKAVADLKSFIEKELSYSTRASKSARTAVPANNAQVQHIQQQNAAAGKKTGDGVPETPVEGGAKSIMDEIIMAARNGNGSK